MKKSFVVALVALAAAYVLLLWSDQGNRYPPPKYGYLRQEWDWAQMDARRAKVWCNCSAWDLDLIAEYGTTNPEIIRDLQMWHKKLHVPKT